MFQNLSLRNKAIGFAIALSTVPVLLIGTVAYYFANNSITQDVMQYQKAYAVEVADKLSRFMFERYGDIQTVANLAIINDPKLSQIVSQAQKEDTLNSYLKAYGIYDNITIFNLDGSVSVKSRGAVVQNPKDRDYFQQALNQNQPFVSNPEISPSINELVIYLVAPVKDAVTGKTIGIARSRLPLNYIQERIRSFDDREQQIHIIDPLGKTFVSPNKKDIGQDIYTEYPELKKLQANKLADVEIAYSAIDKTDKVLAFSTTPTLTGMPNLNWLILIDNDTAVAFRHQRELLMTLLIGSVITAFIVSAIAVVIANRTTKSINSIVNSITTSTSEIAATIEQQERVATQQAASVNQTTATMTELGTSSRVSAEQAESAAENARQVLALAESSADGSRQVLDLAERGTQTVERTLVGMSTLKEKVGLIGQQTSQLTEQTNQIGSIINIVSDLASQTNLLALNAAIEAVRAGEHGRGFGVVATEIRKLADQCKQSAQKINALILGIKSSIDSTVIATDEGRKTAEEGIKLSQDTATAFTEVTHAINEVVLSKQQNSLTAINDIVVGSQQISLNAKQQAIAIEQVADAMNTINQGASQTACGITQTKVGVQKLNEVAQDLKAIV
ncbi:methyl-accepting chemotaxis protein [Phormidium sp. LEGE 05292]|uniref:methyl-accepting chemotaxis protein n=1 Tax=[Phormidium] sp. LEGE 05292 TaxID=767427 RepID=UPI00187DE73B|nr:methyl-accepting chemotaxis protein [Phormidium sp. LEGE 05292]MBE9230058.1 methyl-accepting chemotaxis protein [Phormidium sp. LEGE 05292]